MASIGKTTHPLTYTSCLKAYEIWKKRKGDAVNLWQARLLRERLGAHIQLANSKAAVSSEKLSRCPPPTPIDIQELIEFLVRPSITYFIIAAQSIGPLVNLCLSIARSIGFPLARYSKALSHSSPAFHPV